MNKKALKLIQKVAAMTFFTTLIASPQVGAKCDAFSKIKTKFTQIRKKIENKSDEIKEKAENAKDKIESKIKKTPEQKEADTSKLVTGISEISDKIGSAIKIPDDPYAIIKDTSSIDTSFTNKWTSSLKDDAKFCEILFPGTHDSGTYSMAPDHKLNTIARAAQTQDMDFYNQLKIGVRAFDVRVRDLGDKIVVNHGVVNGCNVEEVLDSVLKFYFENPSEVVFLVFKNSDVSAVESLVKLPKMKEIMNKSLTKDVCTKIGKPLSQITVGDMRKEGKNFVLVSNIDNNSFHKTSNFNYKYNEKTRNSSTDVMVDQELKYLYEYPTDTMRNISPVHTDLEKEFFQGKASPMESEYKYGDERNEILLGSNVFHKKANIVSIDAAGKNEQFIKKLIEINRERNLFKK